MTANAMPAGRNTLTPQQWAKRLNDQWDHIRETAVDGFFALGADLIAAREQMGLKGYGKGYGKGYEGWGDWCQGELRFGYRVAMRLAKLALWKDERQICHNVTKSFPPDYLAIDFDKTTFGRTVRRIVGRWDDQSVDEAQRHFQGGSA
jgi:hypothetical protein